MSSWNTVLYAGVAGLGAVVLLAIVMLVSVGKIDSLDRRGDGLSGRDDDAESWEPVEDAEYPAPHDYSNRFQQAAPHPAPDGRFGAGTRR
ncbi:hypothetical protein [Nocardia bovistercoris]|uniref:Uncharacterized protein n=1 Tax=Nocardia bovistercoris TaxID=2785916 RepID=A0A931IF23_9NOCA|nr:hypothetical protein [Nocardia bovistercoris]MBH0779281.1 hypothetical protein [Nocardia bovistercoris]